MDKIIGRDKEKKILEEAFASERAEFIAVYGRRRVGKTYLVRNVFHDRKDTTFFYATGIKDASLSEQLEHSIEEVTRVFHKVLFPAPRKWKEFFFNLMKRSKLLHRRKLSFFLMSFLGWLPEDLGCSKCWSIIGTINGLGIDE